MTGSCLLVGYGLNLNGILSDCLVRATYLSSTFIRNFLYEVYCVRFFLFVL